MNPPGRLRVAIVGAGIGGLTFALALSRLDGFESLAVDIYEAAPELSQVGAGIAVSPRTWEILKNLGLEESLSKHRTRIKQPDIVFRFRKGDQPEGVTIRDFVVKGGMPTFHRGDVQQVLLKHLGDSCNYHLSHRLASYTESGSEVILQFEDGSTATCDLVVGADGLRSPVRKSLLGRLSKDHEKSLDPTWSGTFAYRGLVPSELLAQHLPAHRALTTPIMYWGKNKHLVVYPISNGRLINVVAFCTDLSKEDTVFPGANVVDVSKEEVASMYSGWEEEVQALLKCIEKPSRWAVHALSPLKLYAQGRVALIGDAAHAMTPHQGSGAGQAIEDAYILASLILGATRAKVPISRATEIYNTIRLPVGNGVLNASRNQGKLYEMTAPGFEHIRECDSTVPFNKLEDLVARVMKGWSWAWTTSVEPDRKRALAML